MSARGATARCAQAALNGLRLVCVCVPLQRWETNWFLGSVIVIRLVVRSICVEVLVANETQMLAAATTDFYILVLDVKEMLVANTIQDLVAAAADVLIWIF